MKRAEVIPPPPPLPTPREPFLRAIFFCLWGIAARNCEAGITFRG
jgi:hypothetical protein